jgi:hypothetical protein
MEYRKIWESWEQGDHSQTPNYLYVTSTANSEQLPQSLPTGSPKVSDDSWTG